MHSIVTSVEHCPKLMRLALRQLWLRVAERFKDPEHVVSRLSSTIGTIFNSYNLEMFCKLLLVQYRVLFNKLSL